MPPGISVWVLRVQSREHGVGSLWPRERWRDEVCPSQPICMSPSGSQGARLPRLITQGTVFRLQCDSGTFEVRGARSPMRQWPSGLCGCEHGQPWVLWASARGSEGQREALAHRGLQAASVRQAGRPGREAARQSSWSENPQPQMVTWHLAGHRLPPPDAVWVGGGRRGCASKLSFPQVTHSSG